MAALRFIAALQDFLTKERNWPWTNFAVGALAGSAAVVTMSLDGDPLSPPLWLAGPAALAGGLFTHFVYKYKSADATARMERLMTMALDHWKLTAFLVFIWVATWFVVGHLPEN